MAYLFRKICSADSAATVSIGCCLCALPLCWMLGIHDQWEISPPREQIVDGARGAISHVSLHGCMHAFSVGAAMTLILKVTICRLKDPSWPVHTDVL